MGLVLAEIAVEVVFIAALMAAAACLVYLVALTLLEQWVLRDGRARVSAAIARPVQTLAERDEPGRRMPAGTVVPHGPA